MTWAQKLYPRLGMVLRKWGGREPSRKAIRSRFTVIDPLIVIEKLFAGPQDLPQFIPAYERIGTLEQDLKQPSGLFWRSTIRRQIHGYLFKEK